MGELLLDVQVEFDALALAREPNPVRTIAEVSRHVAEEQCAATNARLRHPDPRDIVVRRGLDPITGDQVMAVATRWVADGPSPVNTEKEISDAKQVRP